MALQKPDYWGEAKTYLANVDPVMAELIAQYYGEEGMQNRGDAFETLVRAIVGQQISVKAADAVWGRVQAAFPIKPTVLVAAEGEALKGCGLSRQKVKYIQGTARKFVDGEMHVAKWQEWDDEAIITELITLPGIGRWTAEMFLMFHLLRPDVLPLADLGLLKGFEQHYEKPRDALAQHAEVWRPYRSVATWYLWRALDPVPVAY